MRERDSNIEEKREKSRQLREIAIWRGAMRTIDRVKWGERKHGSMIFLIRPINERGRKGKKKTNRGELFSVEKGKRKHRCMGHVIER